MHTQQNTRSLVFDLGGGTFDVTVLEYATPVIEVHASAGATSWWRRFYPYAGR
nr:Hsp70 family protein [Escherichia coli]